MPVFPPATFAVVATVERTYTVVGLKKKRKEFTNASNISFEQLQMQIKTLWPFYQAVEFDVYTEAAVRNSNKKKGNAEYRALLGSELTEVRQNSNQFFWHREVIIGRALHFDVDTLSTIMYCAC